MSSSGLIYAFIVGAWAVYLVPMWLRREDELNKARQTQRYTTAIKVLSHKDSFERRYGAADEKEQARELPLAAGQAGPAPAAGQRTMERVKQKDRERTVASAPPSRRVTARVAGGGVSGRVAGGRMAAEAAGAVDRAGVGDPVSVSGSGSASASDIEDASSLENEVATSSGVWTPAPLSASSGARGSARSASGGSGSGSASGTSAAGMSAASASASDMSGSGASASGSGPSGGLGPRSGLRARRRRVVGVLFAVTSLGALVSADLGLAYVWAMLLPAAVLSAYIASCRKEERARAAERARRHAAAVKAAAREAERREQEHQRQLAEAERLEREELARRSAVARRRVAAARSRAERRTTPGRPDQGDLPRAANG
jgi:hypothetical protein